jgi:hypothetical protein
VSPATDSPCSTGIGALSCFFLICKAFISRAFSGVIVGVFGGSPGDNDPFVEVPELVPGRPELVGGRKDVTSSSGEVGVVGRIEGDKIVAGCAEEDRVCGLSFNFFEPLENNFSPAGNVDIGR